MMNREEYMAELARYLRKLPEPDYQDALNYFKEGFDAVGKEGEAERIKELGSPKDAAFEILSKLLTEDIKQAEKKEKRKKFINKHEIRIEGRRSRFGLILACLVAAPIGIPIAIGAILIALLACIISFSIIALILACIVAVVWVLASIFYYGVLGIFSSTYAEIAIVVGLGLIGLSCVLFLVTLLMKAWQLIRTVSRRLTVAFMAKVRKNK